MFSLLFGVSRRWEMSLLLFTGIMLVYLLRVNMSVAAPKMKEELRWTEEEKGYVLSAFYWGYAVGQMPSVLYAKIYGGKWLFGLSILIPSILTLFVPIAAKSSLGWILCLRGLTGLFESASFPAAFYFFPLWVPPNEKTILIPVIHSGMYLGEIIGFSTSGFVIETVIETHGVQIGGWPSVFYMFSILGILWFPVWMYCAYESPSDHPFISSTELELIQSGYRNVPSSDKVSCINADECSVHNSLKDKLPSSYQPLSISDENQQKILTNTRDNQQSNDMISDIPWKAIFTNKSSLTCFACSWCFGFIGFMLLSEMPSYLTGELKFDLQSAGLLCIAPFASQFAVTIGLGAMFDYLQSEYHWKARTVRQCAQFIALGGSGGLLVIAGFTNDVYGAFALVTAAQALLGAAQSGQACVYLEIAPRYSSILNTIGNSTGSVAGIIGPILVAVFIDTWTGVWGWRIVFILCAVMCIIALSLWAVYQTSDIIPELNNPINVLETIDETRHTAKV